MHQYEGHENWLMERTLFSYPKLKHINDTSDLEIFITDDCKISVGFEEFVFFDNLDDLRSHFNTLLEKFKEYMIREKYEIDYDDNIVIRSFEFYIYKQHWTSHDDEKSEGFYYGINVNSNILEDSIIDAYLKFEMLVKNISNEIDCIMNRQ